MGQNAVAIIAGVVSVEVFLGVSTLDTIRFTRPDTTWSLVFLRVFPYAAYVLACWFYGVRAMRQTPATNAAVVAARVIASGAVLGCLAIGVFAVVGLTRHWLGL